MSNRKTKRILSELKELEKSYDLFSNNGVHYHYNEENINIIYIMIIGSKDTPYENGFYFFKLEYPDNYPMTPPKMNYCTQGILPLYGRLSKTDISYFNVRFNPNLYTNEKVCLSMLNTWMGPGWVPTNTITNIIVAIQALVLNEEPLRNEPGYEHSCDDDIDKYNNIIQYANLKIAILDQLKTKNLGDFECFRNKINNIFLNNIDLYKNSFEKIKNMDKDIITSPAYAMNLQIDYENLINYFTIMKCKLMIMINNK